MFSRWILLVLIALTVISMGGILWIGGAELSQVPVRASQPIQAYSRIQPGDLSTVTASSSDGRIFSSSVNLIGDVAKISIQPNSIITEGMVIDLPQLQQDRWLLSVPISFTVYPSIGDTVLLLGVDGKEGSVVEISDNAVVLGIEHGNAIVAIDRKAINHAAKYYTDDRLLLIVKALQ